MHLARWNITVWMKLRVVRVNELISIIASEGCRHIQDNLRCRYLRCYKCWRVWVLQVSLPLSHTHPRTHLCMPFRSGLTSLLMCRLVLRRPSRLRDSFTRSDYTCLGRVLTVRSSGNSRDSLQAQDIRGWRVVGTWPRGRRFAVVHSFVSTREMSLGWTNTVIKQWLKGFVYRMFAVKCESMFDNLFYDRHTSWPNSRIVYGIYG